MSAEAGEGQNGVAAVNEVEATEGFAFNPKQPPLASFEEPVRASAKKGRPRQRPFPTFSFKQAAELAEAMVAIAGGSREVRRITLFDHLGRSPESGPTRQAVTQSARYGLTEGGYKAEMLKLTDEGFAAVSPDVSARERARAQFRLAIEHIDPFRGLYEHFSNNKLPAQQVMRDFLVTEQHFDDTDAKEAVELFIVNARDVGLLKTMSGAERILTLELMLDGLPAADTAILGPFATGQRQSSMTGAL